MSDDYYISNSCPCCSTAIETKIPWHLPWEFPTVQIKCECGAELEGDYDELLIYNEDGGIDDVYEYTFFKVKNAPKTP